MSILSNATLMIQIFCSAMIAILFLQSGLDKVFNWKDELAWIGKQFANSPIAKFTPLLLGVVTITEVAAGACSLFGLVLLILNGDTNWSYIGALLAAANMVFLFFGQRMSKEYGGAASLIPYFLMMIASLYIYSL